MNLHVLPDFEVIDESEDWMVVDKPAPLIVHPVNRQSEPTLLGGVEALLMFERENGMKPAIVNRLDRETSGLVLVAKHPASARQLGMLFERRQVTKEYLAIVNGVPSDEEWTVEAPIVRAGDFEPSRIWVRQTVHRDGKPSATRFRVLDRFENGGEPFSIVQCSPKTGRMHQIRVHLLHSGHPIVGDKLYSGNGDEYLEWMQTGWSNSLEKRLHLNRHALHASRLEIIWKGQRVSWIAPTSRDFVGFRSGNRFNLNPEIVIWNRDH